MHNSREVIRPPLNIDRRSVSYSSKPSNNGGVEKTSVERRHLRIYVGDMVQVIDPGSNLCRKFGLVERILPHNKEWQVLVKIGPKSNGLFFNQLKFCTRIGPTGGGERNGSESNGRVSDYIDEVDEDNAGNREGANEGHSSERNGGSLSSHSWSPGRAGNGP